MSIPRHLYHGDLGNHTILHMHSGVVKINALINTHKHRRLTIEPAGRTLSAGSKKVV